MFLRNLVENPRARRYLQLVMVLLVALSGLLAAAAFGDWWGKP